MFYLKSCSIDVKVKGLLGEGGGGGGFNGVTIFGKLSLV